MAHTRRWLRAGGYFLVSMSVALFLLALGTGISASPQAKGPRVVAIGDVHGDLDAFVALLQRLQLIDPMLRWSGGKTTLVQTGDILDRGPKARAVMDLMMSLQKDAPRQGGRVVALMGNHEAMNIFGDLRYVTNNDYASFADDNGEKGKKKTEKNDSGKPEGYMERCAALGPDGKYGKWLRSLPAIAKVDDTIFLHGGINPALATYTVEKINEEISAEIKSFDAFKQFMVDKKLVQPCDTMDDLTKAAKAAMEKAKGKDLDTLKAFLGIGAWLSINENGPLWFRGYAQWTEAEGEPQIQRLAEAFSAARFVVGHTPQPGGQIATKFNGKVYLIDTGMLSTYFPGGHASALNIQDGKISLVY